jgi:hypothetical protein
LTETGQADIDDSASAKGVNSGTNRLLSSIPIGLMVMPSSEELLSNPDASANSDSGVLVKPETNEFFTAGGVHPAGPGAVE